MQTNALEGGFAQPAQQSALAFRAIMDVLARPGQIKDLSGAIPPLPLSIAAGTALLTLCDTDTGVYLAGDADCAAVREWIAFHIGAPLVGPSHADFAVGTWAALVPISAYPIGTAEYPDRSTTLIVETDALEAAGSKGATLTGPGIQQTAQMHLPEVAVFQHNHALFPLGLDFFFTSGSRIAALPRSTEVR